MKLWLVSRKDVYGYDEYDSMVVATNTEEEARNTSPGGLRFGWGRPVLKEDLTVEYLGTTDREISGVILASFNAG